MSSILVIEDEAAMTRLITWSLIEQGFEVAAVGDTDSAFKKVADYKPDVIVFNTVIDDDDKVAAMSELRRLAPGVRVLDVSEEKNQRARGMITSSRDGAAADASLRLPFPTDQLVAAIRELLGAPRNLDGANRAKV